MYIRKLAGVFGTSVNGNQITFKEGDFRVSVNCEERDEFPRETVHGRLLAELYSKAGFTRRERNDFAAYLQSEVDGWTTTLAAVTKHCEGMREQNLDQFFSIRQLAALHYIIRTEKIDLTGQPAYNLIELLWRLTPGARTIRNARFPKPSKEELGTIRLVKFVDESFGGKVSLHFHLPNGKMVAKMFGAKVTKSANIRHLGQILAGGANIHPHIVTPCEDVPIEDIDPGLLFD